MGAGYLHACRRRGIGGGGANKVSGSKIDNAKIGNADKVDGNFVGDSSPVKPVRWTAGLLLNRGV